MLKILQTAILKAVCLGILVMGGLMLAFPVSELYAAAAQRTTPNPMARRIVGGVAVAVAIAGLFPRKLGRSKSRQISFPTTHGTSIIELAPVEKTLAKALKKLPEIRNISVRLLPVENDRKVRIVAEAHIVKGTEAGLRELNNVLCERIMDNAREILGVGEVVSVDLHVHNIRSAAAGPGPAAVNRLNRDVDLSIDDEEYLDEEDEEEVEADAEVIEAPVAELNAAVEEPPPASPPWQAAEETPAEPVISPAVAEPEDDAEDGLPSYESSEAGEEAAGPAEAVPPEDEDDGEYPSERTTSI